MRNVIYILFSLLLFAMSVWYFTRGADSAGLLALCAAILLDIDRIVAQGKK